MGVFGCIAESVAMHLLKLGSRFIPSAARAEKKRERQAEADDCGRRFGIACNLHVNEDASC